MTHVQFCFSSMMHPHSPTPPPSPRSTIDGTGQDGRTEHGTVWRKEGYHGDYTKSPVLPDDRDDITEYVELLAMLDTPG